MNNVVFVTGNQHKADLLSKLVGFHVPHHNIDIEEIQALDIADVAKYKAMKAYDIIRNPVLVDDFGTYFDALDGLPGAFTKFFVNASNGPETMCRMLDSFNSRKATASSVMVYFDGKDMRTFRGGVRGTISDHPRGSRGIGTDTIFEAEGYGGRTRAELSESEYDHVFGLVRPITEVKKFLEGLK